MPTPARNPDESAPPALKVDAWAAIPGLVHGFYGRKGGVSRGPLAGLNLSDKVGDAPETVARNWRLITDPLASTRIARMTQVHGAQIARVSRRECAKKVNDLGEYDGLLTGDTGVALTVMTADCVPILMVAPAHRAAMALHAGWRGTLSGIAATGLATAKSALGIAAHEWEAALGPAIDGCCYEVTADIGAKFENHWGSMPDAWRPEGQHGQLDLRRVNARILAQSGVPINAIHAVGPCTACAHERYFSHRASHGKAGRQASLIGFDREFGVVSTSDDR